MGFADLEDRADQAVMRRLANARALVVGAADDFPVIFDSEVVEPVPGVNATALTFDALNSDLAGVVPHQTQVVIDGGQTYTVRDKQPLGSGMSRVVLEVA